MLKGGSRPTGGDMGLSRRLFLIGGIGAFLTACSDKFKTYNGPDVTKIQVFKGARTMQLLHQNVQLKSYKFELGFAPAGHKIQRGDGKTPIGLYKIDRRNPESAYHLSIGISYPDVEDRARAAALGVNPGGDIFIHGTPREKLGQRDWTWGCIAVKNHEMEDIYAMVKNGTPIAIFD